MSPDEHLPSPLRVLIVDQHQVSRAAIGALLRTEGLDVVADVSTASQALAIGNAISPDVAIVDISHEPEQAIAAARALAGLPCAPAVLLTSSTAVSVDLDGLTFLAKGDICARHLRLAMQPQHIKETRMSMQTYLDNITARTGKTPEELIEHARADGVLEPGWKAGQVVAWLKDEYGLGHGHAMAIVAMIKKQTTPRASADEKVNRHFTGKKAHWRPVYDELIQTVTAFGPDTDVLAGGTYLSLRRAGKKFAIVNVTGDRLDVGIKLKGVAADGRLEPAGSWNSMVTHRVRIHNPADVDPELVEWVQRAYVSA
jgi:CheY-like chemotaxis protein